jgi:uncharacterized membrane protein
MTTKRWTLCCGSRVARAMAVLPLLAACGDAHEQMSCDDLLPASEATFSQLQALVTSRGKGCSSSDCHGSEEAAKGYRLDEPSLIYDEFTNRIDSVYAEVASGSMPEGGRRWSDADLQLVRTWYCNGASPND